MTDEKYRDMVLSHDKHIDTLASSIETLAESFTGTNVKLDNIVEALQTQNIIIERMNNLDNNLKETFNRYDARIKTIENCQNTIGCPALNLEQQKLDLLETSVEKLVDKIDDVIENQRNYISATTIKWGLFWIVSYLITFGVYVVQTTHKIDNSLIADEVRIEKLENN